MKHRREIYNVKVFHFGCSDLNHPFRTTMLQQHLDQGCATIYLNEPKRIIVIMLRAEQCSTKQKQLLLLFLVCKKSFSINLNKITEKLAAQYR